MGAADLEHLVADVARRHHVVAEEHEEALPRHGIGRRADGMAEAVRLVLETEVYGKAARLGNGIGISGLSTRTQKLFKGRIRLEVAQKLRLVGARHDDGVRNLLGFERLLYHVLDNRLVKHGKHFLGRALGRRQKAGAQARGGDDGLH